MCTTASEPMKMAAVKQAQCEQHMLEQHLLLSTHSSLAVLPPSPRCTREKTYLVSWARFLRRRPA